MKIKIFEFILIFLFIATTVYAHEPFVATCEEGETHRYQNSNGLSIFGDKMINPKVGWSIEKWWGKDEIRWDGGKELLINNGKMKLVNLNSNGESIRALHINKNNLYIITIYPNIGTAVLTQQQTVAEGKHKYIKTRTANLICQFE